MSVSLARMSAVFTPSIRRAKLCTSPALSIIDLLRADGADVYYHDPFVPSFQEEDIRHESVPLTDDELDRCDAVVIVTDHSNIDYQRLVDRAPLVIDTRNATARTGPGRARIVSLSSGHALALTEPMATVGAGKGGA